VNIKGGLLGDKEWEVRGGKERKMEAEYDPSTLKRS
jgi:hypothetical protein